MAASSHHYRPDIDGLRALAIIPVVLFHYFPALMPGGFIGVDIFFVISGYLITSIIWRQTRAGQFSLFGFYSRRIRRIFPALAIVLAAGLAFGAFTLFWDEYKRLGLHAALSAASAANLGLWAESGYFDQAADLKPFLHMWSLGVEEQFYIAWPLVLLVLARLGRGAVPVAATLALTAFIASTVVVGIDPVQAFYSPLTRSWELLLGAIIAMLPVLKARRVIADVGVLAGVGLIGAGLLFITEGVTFPGVAVLLPVLGSGLVVACGGQSWIAGKLLGNRPMVAVGLISFPLYLWHWPVVSFYRILSGNRMEPLGLIILLAASVGLACITYPLAERIRFQSGRWVIPVLVAVMAGVAGAGLLVFSSGGMTWRPATVQWLQLDEYNETYPEFLADHGLVGCSGRPDIDVSRVVAAGANYCVASGREGKLNAALIGDSHADDKIYGLSDLDTDRNWLLLGNSGCPLQWSLYPQAHDDWRPSSNKAANECAAKFSAIVDFVTGDNDLRLVALSFFNQVDLSKDGDWAVPGSFDPFAAEGNVDRPRLVGELLERTVSRLEAAGKIVAIFMDAPGLLSDPRDCLRRGDSLDCTQEIATVEQRSVRNYREMLANLKVDHPSLIVVDPLPTFCPDDLCPPSMDGHLLYRDDHHLTSFGSTVYARGALVALPALAAAATPQ